MLSSYRNYATSNYLVHGSIKPSAISISIANNEIDWLGYNANGARLLTLIIIVCRYCIMYSMTWYKDFTVTFYRFGPVKTMWCMRYEAKHHYFKKIARTIGNFKNIAKSVAFRHQRHICYVLSEPDMFLKDRIELGRGQNFHFK